MLPDILRTGNGKPAVTSFRIISILFITIFVLCIFSEAHAHKVNIYAYAEDGKIHSEGYFVDGSKCRNSLVEVFDQETGEKLLEGRTGEDGRFSFEIPKLASLRLVLNASMGHGNDYIMTADEVREAMGAVAAQDKSHEAQPVKHDLATVGSSQSRPVSAVDNIPVSAIEAIVEKTMDKKLRPITRMLVNLQEKIEKPGLAEIAGGIGYIMGLMGIALYFKSRRSS